MPDKADTVRRRSQSLNSVATTHVATTQAATMELVTTMRSSCTPLASAEASHTIGGPMMAGSRGAVWAAGRPRVGPSHGVPAGYRQNGGYGKPDPAPAR
jgi:hypothetical protein